MIERTGNENPVLQDHLTARYGCRSLKTAVEPRKNLPGRIFPLFFLAYQRSDPRFLFRPAPEKNLTRPISQRQGGSYSGKSFVIVEVTGFFRNVSSFDASAAFYGLCSVKRTGSLPIPMLMQKRFGMPNRLKKVIPPFSVSGLFLFSILYYNVIICWYAPCSSQFYAPSICLYHFGPGNPRDRRCDRGAKVCCIQDKSLRLAIRPIPLSSF
jgi:hypothetical protein